MFEGKFSKTKDFFEKEYKKTGSTRKLAKKFGYSQAWAMYWLKKFEIKVIPTKLFVGGNNTAKGRLAELYIHGHPNFKSKFKDALKEKGDKAPHDGELNKEKSNIKSSHWQRPIFRVKEKKHRCKWYICLWFNDKVSAVVPREIWVVPAKTAPLSNITIGLGDNSAYDKYRLSKLRGKGFSRRKELQYNKAFGNKYRKHLPRKKEKDGKK